MSDNSNMPLGSQGYGFGAHQAGRQAAHDLANGTITKDDLIRQYKQHKDSLQGDDFKAGYGDGADQVFHGH